MQRFQHGECMALVATDVAARGIDVEGVNCVIHYDPPENGKAYKHRSGRTARGGSSGVVFLGSKTTKKSYSKIQKAVGINTEFTPPDFSLIPEFEVEFIGASRRRSQGSRNRNDSLELIIEINATEGTMALEIVHKPISQPKKNNKRAYNKKKPRNTHSRPNRGNKPPKKQGNKSGFSNKSRGGNRGRKKSKK